MTYEEEKAKLEAEILVHVKAGRAAEAVTAGEKLKQLEAEKATREQKDREDREARIRAEAEKDEEKRRREKEKKAYPEAWMRKIPIGRRFVLAVPEKTRSTSHYSPRDEIVPIDLATGYMEPYFGYYGSGAIEMSLGAHAGLEVIDEMRDSTDVLAYLNCLKYPNSSFDFFHINNHHKGVKFGIAPFTVDQKIIEEARLEYARKYPGSDPLRFYYGDAYGALKVGNRGPCKTWEEHLEDLKREFGGDE